MKTFHITIVRPLAKGFMETLGPYTLEETLMFALSGDDTANIRIMGPNTSYVCRNGVTLILRTK